MPPRKTYPNTEWAEWVQEEAEKAAKKNSKASDTYRKAAKTIRNHPVKLLHPKDALVLPGVGDKIRKIISVRLEEQCIANQTPFPPQVPLGEGSSKRALSLDDSVGPSAAKQPRLSSDVAQNGPPLALVAAGNRRTPSANASNGEASSTDTTGSASAGPGPGRRTKHSNKPNLPDAAREILVAMYSFCDPTDLKQFNSEETIIERAAAIPSQQGTDQFRTPWHSGIETLLRRNLICSHASLRPRKYALSQAGYGLASVIAIEKGHRPPDIANPSERDNPQPTNPPNLQIRHHIRTAFKFTHDEEDAYERSWLNGEACTQSLSDKQPCASDSRSPLNANRALDATHDQPPLESLTSARSKAIPQLSLPSPKPFDYFYVDPDGHRVYELHKAATSSGPSLTEGCYKIEFRAHQRHLHFCRNNVFVHAQDISSTSLITGSDSSTMIGWIKPEKATPTCSGFAPTYQGDTLAANVPQSSRGKAFDSLLMGQTSGSRPPTSIYKPPVSGSAAAPHVAPSHITTQSTVQLMNKAISSTTAPPVRRPVNENSAPIAQPAHQIAYSLKSAAPSSSSLSLAKNAIEMPAEPNERRVVAQPRASFATANSIPSGILKPRASIGTVSLAAKDVRPDVWKAGSYSIILIIDNREVKSQNDRDGIFNLCASKARQKMGSKGKVQQRPLAVGDALWIAVQNTTGKEVVLDSIVERKRLDDLCKSIMDSRFHEQKARLKNSGLKDKIYIVEAFDTKANREQYGQQIQTSTAELMVLNGCHLQPTANCKDSVDYLVMRTEVLHRLHEKIDLSVIPDKHIDRSSYLPLLSELRRARPSEHWVTSYSVFHSLNDKSANLTVKEIWGRMINQINGMSAEKVGEFVKRWPTPGGFWDEFHKQELAGSAGTTRTDSQRCGDMGKWIEEQLNRDVIVGRKILGAALIKKIVDLYALGRYH